ncbi:ABC transporter permease [Candidatus Chloroploca asiatica]|uniref:ABC-2 type transporter transmembrane domain-containing protein n=1 Tax=Candidatus Chloroploca asiatica TaxID=1506545 RepID=A0A2H3KIZ1_9CHLR|nr:ABC transporter permease [Candidatus Chloroploca asiatica]PDV97836.1 hypothetical protein A9Q02_17460 [Candidatus Chloroploca asiatica]
MQRTFLVARHEFLRHVLRPSFLITTLLFPLILGAVMLFMRANATTSPDELAAFTGKPLGYVDDAGVFTLPVPASLTAQVQALSDVASGVEAIQAGALQGFYHFPEDYLQGGTVVWVSEDVTGPQGQALIATLLQASLLADHPELVTQLGRPLALQLPTEDGQAELATAMAAERGMLTFVLPYAFAMVLYITIFSAASFLLQSVTEEKENRTIELVLTTIRPLALLTGKVLGLGLLGFVQVSIWLAAGMLLLKTSTGALEQAGLAVPWTAVVLALVYYLLGYLVYGSLLAGVGATVTHMREGSQLVAVLIIPCIVPLWFMTAIIDQPDSLLARGLSFFPMTAPVTMMIRVPLTTIPLWEIMLSVSVLLASAIACLWVAARLFRAGTLLAGQRLDARAIVKSLG